MNEVLELTDEMKAVLTARYGNDWEVNQDEDSPEALALRIQNEASRLEKEIISYQTDKFSWSDINLVTSLPQYQFPGWSSIDGYFETFAPKGGVLLILPSIWQLLYGLQPVIRKHKLYSLGETISNVPLCTAMVRDARIATVITYKEAALSLAEGLKQRGLGEKLKLMIVIGDPESLLTSDLKQQLHDLLPETTILFDVQVFPGHTVAFQSFALRNSANQFHLSDEYCWEIDDKRTLLTGISSAVFPLLRHRLSAVAKKVDTDSAEPVFELSYV